MNLLNVKVIGSGAAGNKCAIDLIKYGIVDRSDVLLINSTIKDIQEEYHDISYILSEDATEGCGKERDRAIRLMADAISNNKLDLEGFITKDVDTTILIGSTAGGTGSGSVPFLARYIRDYIDTSDEYDEDDDEYLRANVHVIALKGFGVDGREYENTISFFKDIQENFTVECIDNSKFLETAKGNITEAEKLANLEVCSRVAILTGKNYIDSDQNIDKKDQYKVVTMPGYMTIDSCNINSKIKNIKEFNQFCEDLIDDSRSLSVSATCKRLAVILNIPKSWESAIDRSFEVFKAKLGFPYEMFTQIQYADESSSNYYIGVMASGMNMPLDELERLYGEYQKASGRVNKSQDSFFEKMRTLQGNSEDSMFNGDIRSSKPKKSKSDFLGEFAKPKKKKVNVLGNSKSDKF